MSSVAGVAMHGPHSHPNWGLRVIALCRSKDIPEKDLALRACITPRSLFYEHCLVCLLRCLEGPMMTGQALRLARRDSKHKHGLGPCVSRSRDTPWRRVSSPTIQRSAWLR